MTDKRLSEIKEILQEDMSLLTEEDVLALIARLAAEQKELGKEALACDRRRRELEAENAKLRIEIERLRKVCGIGTEPSIYKITEST